MEREKVKAVTWPPLWGSLDDVVTCESSLDCDSHSDDSNSAQPYVVLRRPQPDSGPCQITIEFGQHHEIKQVYVRSSARVYEIYYDADSHYLCTVRCGPITCSFSTHDDAPLQPNFQYLFEATAEVTDADPLLSLTLRFLSIQSGDYIRIDQIYVFADPVVVSPHVDSSPNPLISMLIPTLMHLSKSPITQTQERNHTCSEQIEQQEKAQNKSNFITNALQTTMLNGASMDHMSEPHAPLQKPDPISSPPVTATDTLSTHIQRSLDELVSRVANIEQFCLKFEDKLLKPITNMEARLVKIEQQLESFSRTSCTRISESNYMCNDGIESHSTKKWDSTNKDDCLVVTTPDLEQNDTAETAKNSSNECRPSKAPSLSDALASALDGFLSSASADCTSLPDFVQSNYVNEANRTNAVSSTDEGSPTQQGDYCDDLEKDVQC